MITVRELRLLRLVHAQRAGNPYHDPATGEFTSGPGGSGDPAKRARRRAKRKRRREALRKRFKVEAKELKESHAWERRERRKDERADFRKLRAETRKEWNATIKAARKDLAKAGTARERNEIRARTRDDLANLKADYRQRKSDLKAEHASQRKTDAATHHEEWESFRDDLKTAIADEGFKPRKRHLDGDFPPGERGEPVSDPVARRAAGGIRFGAGRTHKASSAEAILAHCLRQLGLTRRYRDGRLTARQARRLLESIRRYGRAWLRHEAEQVVASVNATLDRGIRWKDDLGGFLHAEETGVRASLGRFFARAKQFVRETIVAGAMALLGPAPLTAEELDAAEREAQKQEQFFDRFQREATAPPAVKEMTPAQFVARAEQYADSVHHAAQNINHDAAVRQGIARMERLVMGHPKTEHCPECPEDAAKGWQPVGSLRPIGSRQCGHLCLCHFEYQDASGKTFYQGKRGPLPSPPRPADLEPDDGGVYMVAEPPGGLKEPVPIAGLPKK